VPSKVVLNRTTPCLRVGQLGRVICLAPRPVLTWKSIAISCQWIWMVRSQCHSSTWSSITSDNWTVSPTEAETVSYGNPWATSVYLLFILGALVFQAVLAAALLVSGLHTHHAAPFVTGLFFAPLLILEVVLLTIVLVRHPSRLRRVIRLTPTELQLPDTKWRSVPVGDISGVALARHSKARGSKHGSRAPIFWRTDATHAYVSGIGFFTSKQDPSGTKPAQMVTDIYKRVSEIQGADGSLLAKHHPGLSPYGWLDKVWDPGAVLPGETVSRSAPPPPTTQAPA
jgi:hypothetical protein